MNDPDDQNIPEQIFSISKPFRNNWSEAVHYIVLSVAILISAFWGLYTFNAFSLKEKAMTELDSVNKEIVKKKAEIAEIQKRLDGNFSSDIVLNTDIIDLDNGKYGLIIDVIIKNVGTKDVLLNLKEKPLTIYQLIHSKDKLMATSIFNPQYYEKISKSKDIKNKIFNTQKILIGASKHINFFTEVDERGIYYITFRADLSKEHKELLEKSHIWFASSYVHVGG